MNTSYFTTMAVNGFNPIFQEFPQLISVLLDSFDFMNRESNVIVHGFVIMPDHFHIIWVLPDPLNNIHSFRRHTGIQITKFLTKIQPEYLGLFWSLRKDRNHKIWKTTMGHLEITSQDMYKQKLGYIHNNPTKHPYKFVDHPTEYLYSSASAYLNGKKNFSFLTLKS